MKHTKKLRRPTAAKTTKASKDAPAPRCELCGDECVGKSATTFAEYGLCSTCLTGKQGTHRRTA